MVDMMRGVVQGGGTATGASAGGHPLAGKTGTVNDHTDVWFIGYTPTYATGVWMGNPLRKESLGAGMTGGHGAVPYFTSFMVPFMKDKPRESFPSVPPMPSEVKRASELRKREELEKLEEADIAGRKTGIVFTPGTKIDPNAPLPGEPGGEVPKADGPVTTKPAEPPADKPIVVKPITVQPTPKPAAPVDKPDGSKRKGKKGDG